MEKHIRYQTHLGKLPNDKEIALIKLVQNYLEDKSISLNTTDYDIPYIGGYSNNGEILYIDRHFPKELEIDGVTVPVYRYVAYHEYIEKTVLTLFNVKYQEAHKLATHAENRKVAMLGINPAHYEASLLPHIKTIEHEQLKNVPKDLDLTPYEDENDKNTLKRLMVTA